MFQASLSYNNTTPTSFDSREIKGTNSSLYKLGLTGTILTSPQNHLTASFNYSAANYHSSAFEHLDNDGDGDFTDTGDVFADDSFLAQQYSIKYGLSDRLDLEEKGLAFIAIYGHIFKFKQYASGLNLNGKYDSSVYKSNRFTVPVVLGAEINLTDWLTARISGTKNIVNFTKWYDESSGETYTDYTSEDSLPAINGGLGIHYRNFTLDWLVSSPWSDRSDPLADSFNNQDLNTQFSVSWRF